MHCEPRPRDKSTAHKLIQFLRRGKRPGQAVLRRLLGEAAEPDLRARVAATKELVGLEPSHASHTYALNRVSDIVQELVDFPEMSPFIERLMASEEMYMPNGPPVSPLTRSYYTLWAFFDVPGGPFQETFGSIVLELGKAFGMAPDLLDAIETLQRSRMGLYLHNGARGSVVTLEDLLTGTSQRVVVPAGYLGKRGELWFVRLLPPLYAEDPNHIAMTTPYVIGRPDVHEWLEYFARNGISGAGAEYERHLKYGPEASYWPEYVFEAYVNHRRDLIWLAGLPDIPESRPLSRVNQHWGTVH